MNKTLIDQEDILLALDQLTQTMEVMTKVVNRLKTNLEKIPSPSNTDTSSRTEKVSTTPQKIH